MSGAESVVQDARLSKIFENIGGRSAAARRSAVVRDAAVAVARRPLEGRRSLEARRSLDSAHYCTLPGFTFDACLKFTEQELDLFTDGEKFLFIENSIRGGISVVSHRHAKANNPLVSDYDHNSPHSYLTYLDANNLYGGAMSEALPIGEFTFLAEDEVASFDLNATTKFDDYDYILEVDLKCP